jgi:hypothetical protein
MKALARITVLIVLAALVLPLATVGAQDDDGVRLLSSPQISAVYLQTATTGSFADNGDGTYTLTLEGVGAEILWIFNSPGLQIVSLQAQGLMADWAAAEDLATDATLEIESLNIMLELSSPSYDAEAGVQTYSAVIGELVSLEDSKDEPDLPEAFDAGNLVIAWSQEFEAGLLTGFEARSEGTREELSQECKDAQAAWEAYVAWDAQKWEEQQAATDPDEKSAILYERYMAQMAIMPVVNYLNANCR